jgi:tetratricopeptide (TPR) repeat protein
MDDVHDAIRDLPSSTAAQETVLKTAVRYLDGLAREAGGDRTLQLEVARGYLKASEMAYSLERPSLGRADEGRRYLDLAIAALSPLEAAAAGDPAVAAAVVERYRLTADLALDASRRDDALAALRTGFEIGDRALRAAPDDLPLIATLHDTLVELISTFNTDAWVVGLLPRMLEVSDHRMALQPDDPEARGQLAVTYSQVGNVASARGDAAQATLYYQRAVDLHTAIVQAAPNHTTARRNLMIALANLADVQLGPLGSASYTGSGGPPQPLAEASRAGSLAAYTRACEQAEWLFAQERDNDTAIFDLAVCRGRMAAAYPPADPAAVEALTGALARLQPLGTRHPARVAAFEIEFRGSLAERFRQAGDYARADAEWARVDAVVRAGVAQDPSDFYLQRMAIPILENQAETLVTRGRPADARRVAARVEALAAAVAARADTYARGPGWPPRVRGWLADLLTRLGDAGAAARARAESLAMWQALVDRQDLPADIVTEAAEAVQKDENALTDARR